jgi:hypothetical protein
MRFGTRNPLGDARWIWGPEASRPDEDKGRRYFLRTFEIENADEIEMAQIAITASPSFEVTINGKRVGAGNDYQKVRRFDVTSLLVSGHNEAIIVVNHEGPGRSSVPFALIASLSLVKEGTYSVINTDKSWRASTSDHGPQAPAIERGDFRAAPWKISDASLQEAPLYPSYRITANILRQRGLSPDFSGGEGLRYIHRRDDDEDIFFISNREDREQSTVCDFRVVGRQAE